ncbi:hypothetical protein EPUS_00336 [Endocarpon pusillum Z07020]|uniref:glutathione-specific gamma-glutamylcyclotransferase n=1 Tax=Endocarpon pusillum (strain Z07020 / HMAS-L-300199) TaxID=1263415 RepID=U1HMD8_ENDPU|nr:uncharacterized protein EPUS_00336 [Endocarpon pusillum Z07020]ERF70149.1 hypothetical protein EPUS_00336 [Endocarpon pusillum Z07020]
MLYTKKPLVKDKRLPGYITGYVRRFWQQGGTGSEQVWGAAYHIVPSKVEEVKDYLDIREINGYSVQYTTFHAAHPVSKQIRCLVYIGMPDNPQFLGALHPQDVAERINQSVGPSGENREYLLQLEESLKDLSTESGDVHISDLARRVRSMEPRKGRPYGSQDLNPHKISSTEEQEEIEKAS